MRFKLALQDTGLQRYDDDASISHKIVLIIKEGLEVGMEAKNFTNYLIYINVYMIVLILTYFFFFNTELKRSKVKHLILVNFFFQFKLEIENKN